MVAAWRVQRLVVLQAHLLSQHSSWHRQRKQLQQTHAYTFVVCAVKQSKVTPSPRPRPHDSHTGALTPTPTPSNPFHHAHAPAPQSSPLQARAVVGQLAPLM